MAETDCTPSTPEFPSAFVYSFQRRRLLDSSQSQIALCCQHLMNHLSEDLERHLLDGERGYKMSKTPQRRPTA